MRYVDIWIKSRWWYNLFICIVYILVNKEIFEDIFIELFFYDLKINFKEGGIMIY